MGKESENKAERILSLYTRLKSGGIINKTKESVDFAVNPRTIQRDISDIQSFLSNQNNEFGEQQEIIFDRTVDGYRMETKVQSHLQPKELLAVCKVLIDSRGLNRTEMFPIINKLINACSETEDREMVKAYIGNELHHYVEVKHGKNMLDHIWTLERAVKKHRYVEIVYKKLKGQEEVVRKLKPVGVMFSEFYYYLTAYLENIDKQAAFQNPDDTFPTIYRLDRIEKITVLEEQFFVPYRNRFEEGEFRKRIQFMYGGKLRKVRFRYKGLDVNAVLDRLPTAVVRAENEEGYLIEAEVFGDGIDMWLRSQGDNVLLM